jgi:hypothetical protein
VVRQVVRTTDLNYPTAEPQLYLSLRAPPRPAQI